MNWYEKFCVCYGSSSLLCIYKIFIAQKFSSVFVFQLYILFWILIVVLIILSANSIKTIFIIRISWSFFLVFKKWERKSFYLLLFTAHFFLCSFEKLSKPNVCMRFSWKRVCFFEIQLKVKLWIGFMLRHFCVLWDSWCKYKERWIFI